MNALTVVSTLVELTSAVLALSLRLQQASQVLQRAHIEGWADDDPRWATAWMDADSALTEARERLKG